MNTSFGSGTFSAGRAAFGSAASNSPQFKAANQAHQAVKFGFGSAIANQEDGEEIKPKRNPIGRMIDHFKKH